MPAPEEELRIWQERHGTISAQAATQSKRRRPVQGLQQMQSPAAQMSWAGVSGPEEKQWHQRGRVEPNPRGREGWVWWASSPA